MANKTKLEFTKIQLNSFISIIETIEGMLGCSDTELGDTNWDDDMIKEIRNIDRMLKSNGYSRK